MKLFSLPKLLLLGLSLVLGLLAGSYVTSIFTVKDATTATSQVSKSSRATLRKSGNFLINSHPVRNDLRALQKSSHHSTATAELLRQARSPLRVDSLLEFQMEEENFDVWAQRLADGEIERPEEFSQIARWLSGQDAQRALDIFFQYKVGFHNLDNFYAFRDPLFSTLIDKGQAELVFNELKKLKRGGTQQDNTLTFSRQWAKSDPAQAAEHFEELVSMRNLGSDRGTHLRYEDYGKTLVSSWMKQDSDAAQAFVENYPEGQGKDALQKVLSVELRKLQERE